jgi:transcriptional regulator
MLIHPWDAAIDEAEWREWIGNGHDFGELVVNGIAGQPPVAVPTHFVVEGSVLLVHLARPNPVWLNIERDPNIVFSVFDDYAYIPTMWRAKAGGPDEDGVPTSYYAAVQFSCRAEIIDDPEAKAELLRRQLAHFQPQGGHADVAVGEAPYGRMLPGIRGLKLHITAVAGKFKYDDHNPLEHRLRVAERLTTRANDRDVKAADQQRRRVNRIGTWQPPSSGPKSG